jgi:hypothetical protein
MLKRRTTAATRPLPRRARSSTASVLGLLLVAFVVVSGCGSQSPAKLVPFAKPSLDFSIGRDSRFGSSVAYFEKKPAFWRVTFTNRTPFHAQLTIADFPRLDPAEHVLGIDRPGTATGLVFAELLSNYGGVVTTLTPFGSTTIAGHTAIHGVWKTEADAAGGTDLHVEEYQVAAGQGGFLIQLISSGSDWQQARVPLLAMLRSFRLKAAT